MIREIFENDSSIIELVQENRFRNVYLYIDVMTYGVNADEIRTFVSESDNEIHGLVYEYYNSLQLLSFGKVSESLVSDIAGLIIGSGMKRITGPEDLVSALYERLSSSYTITRGSIMSYSGEKKAIAEDTSFAGLDDFAEIARLICQDHHLGIGYDYENIRKQLVYRYEHENCENMIIRKDGKIISHVATYAVIQDLAVVSGMLTAPDYRNQGHGMKLMTSFSSYLVQSGKQPVLYCYEDEYHSWYEKLGYHDIGSSAKLDLIR
ncbi:MAG: GNAT family N-acetyltransferase [Clostridiales bacterium]|nr:GNAT family N-acetyltransferase [Clostridiales bacterium]